MIGPVIPHEGTSIVQFDPATGAILGYQILPYYLAAPLLVQPGYLAGNGAWDTHYVDLTNRAVREKAPCPARLQGARLTDLPIPCTLVVGLRIDTATGPAMLHDPNGTYTVTDGAAELSFGAPGAYLVEVRSVPFLPGRFTITQP